MEGRNLSPGGRAILSFFSFIFTVLLLTSFRRPQTSRDVAGAPRPPSSPSSSATVDDPIQAEGPIWIRYRPVPMEEERPGRKILRYAAYDDRKAAGEQNPITIERWAETLSANTTLASKLRREFATVLRESPYSAFFFETKGASSSTSPHKQFEFALVDAPYLYDFADGKPDLTTFAKLLTCDPDTAPGCAFTSLSKDATLIAPRRAEGVPADAYAHMAAFMRKAPAEQVDRFLMLVSREYAKALQKGTVVWLSTDGTGVAWLHVRLDSKPKYYHYKVFAHET